jgi:hypothetical protein
MRQRRGPSVILQHLLAAQASARRRDLVATTPAPLLAQLQLSSAVRS